MPDYPAGDVETALRHQFVPDIMVAENVKERHVVFRPEPGQILRGQIPATENQLYGTRLD